MRVLDLFSAAAGGWSLGMHRAGFKTMAACENVAWRRALYQENNPHVRIYDDVCTLTADQLLRDFGYLPRVIVGSPPCQDISSANTKGKGVEGERSGLYFEAIRIIGECRPRWFALENSANLRTRGADAVLDAVEAIGYACWPAVVRARDVGANHERPRSWLIGFNAADADRNQLWQQPGRSRRQDWADQAVSEHNAFDDQGERPGLHGADERYKFTDVSRDASSDGRGPGRAWRRIEPVARLPLEACWHASGATPYTDEAGQEAGLQESSLREAQEPNHGCRHEPVDDVVDTDSQGKSHVAFNAEMGGGQGLSGTFAEPWADWNSGLAGHLRLDDGLSAWVAQSRIAVGGPKGTSAASLIVEAFGDAVLPQIPEAIGRAILRTEQALHAVYGRAA